MRATLSIPDELIMEVQRISREKSKTKAIVTAMEAYVRDRKMTELRALKGKMPLEYDWRQGEAMELQTQREREEFLGK